MKLLDSFSLAWDRMVLLLFKPFSIKRWCLIGFSAFLASFITGEGSNMNFPSGGGSSYGDDKKSAAATINQVWSLASETHASFSRGQTAMPMVKTGGTSLVAASATTWSPEKWGLEVWLPIIVGAVVIFLAVIVVLMWLGCRGQFMLVDNLVKGTALVKAPWKEFKGPANSFFGFYLVIFGASLVALLGFGGAGFAYYKLVPYAETWGYWTPAVLGGLVFIAVFVVFGVVMFFIREFGVLWMYKNGGTAWAASRQVLALGGQHPVDFILYLIIRIVIAIATALLGCVAGCLTCCLGFLPYVGSVLLLPLTTFRVWYSVECFAGLGPDCDVRVATPPPQPPPSLPEPPVGL